MEYTPEVIARLEDEVAALREEIERLKATLGTYEQTTERGSA